MDRELLQYYNRELQFMREMSGEFARAYPKVAGRLALDEFACADPYVERLLEGFAFMSARVHLKMDAEFPRFTQSILETVYPHYLAPTPSMAVIQFNPDPSQASSLTGGFELPRDTGAKSRKGKGDQTSCEYRTAHKVNLLPLELAEVHYHTRDLGTLEIPDSLNARAAIRLRIRTQGGIPFNELNLDNLTFFLRGSDEIPMRIYEQLLGHASGVVVQPAKRPVAWREVHTDSPVRPVGFEEDEALLPYHASSFQGYRLLHEYFVFPQRFLFVDLNGLGAGVRRCEDTELDILVVLSQEDTELEKRIDVSHFALFCSPAINLFPKRMDRVQLTDRFSEHHVVPDRTRAMDFEVYQVTGVTGHGVRSDEEVEFAPFYSAAHAGESEGGGSAYYAVHRKPRTASSREKQYGRRSSYTGSEVYVSLVDTQAAPFDADLRQLSIQALCTNRDLPLQMPTGRGDTDFTLSTSAPTGAVRCVSGPTPPRPSYAEGEIAWRVISHLSLNYLSLSDTSGGSGTSAFQDLLRLYADSNDAQSMKQVDGIRSLSSRPVTRRVSAFGPLSFGRGLEVTVSFDESQYEGSGVFVLGAVLDHFFGRYVSINAFTETVIKTTERGEIMRWPTRVGTKQIL